MGLQFCSLCAAPQSCLQRLINRSLYSAPRQHPAAPLLSTTARLSTAVAAAVAGDMDQGQASTTAEQDAKKLLRQQLKKKLKSLTSESMQQQSEQAGRAKSVPHVNQCLLTTGCLCCCRQTDSPACAAVPLLP
jgi:hypothetical protein